LVEHKTEDIYTIYNNTALCDHIYHNGDISKVISYCFLVWGLGVGQDVEACDPTLQTQSSFQEEQTSMWEF